MDYKKSYQLTEVTMAVFVGTVILAVILDFLWWLMIPGFIIALVGVFLFLKYCKCPHCGHHFNARAKLPNYCPECGRELE